MGRRDGKMRIGVFLLLTFGTSAVLIYLAISAGTVTAWALLAMWSPGIAGMRSNRLWW